MTGVVAALAGSSLTTLTATPASATGGSSSSPVNSNSVIVTVNTAGSFSYAWTYVSGDPAVQKRFADSAVMAWSAILNPGADTSAIWRCTVTQGAVLIGAIDVAVFLQRF